MNIFFLSLVPKECAKMYCDQHVVKILLEIVQMLYTSWHILETPGWIDRAPLKGDGTPGYKIAHPNHPMTMWVRSSRSNYILASNIGMSLAVEYNFRFRKCHACTRHVLWLSQNVPARFRLQRSVKSFYSFQGIPECMPEEFHNPDVVEAYRSYYTSKTFAKWTKRDRPTFIEYMSLKTEDLGKIFERAVCMTFDVPFDGVYKYGDEEPLKLVDRLSQLKTFYPECEHTARNGSKFDFRVPGGHLSAKTTKGLGKVCPQVIGQTTLKKFCEYFGVDSSSDIKEYIENNVPKLLTVYIDNTFECPVLYYNKKTESIKLITIKSKIEWDPNLIQFSHIKKAKKWNDSTTMYYNDKTLGEFQIHKNRDSVKFRWSFEKLLEMFPDNFEVITLG